MAIPERCPGAAVTAPRYGLCGLRVEPSIGPTSTTANGSDSVGDVAVALANEGIHIIGQPPRVEAECHGGTPDDIDVSRCSAASQFLGQLSKGSVQVTGR